jgi:hypothetical protein
MKYIFAICLLFSMTSNAQTEEPAFTFGLSNRDLLLGEETIKDWVMSKSMDTLWLITNIRSRHNGGFTSCAVANCTQEWNENEWRDVYVIRKGKFVFIRKEKPQYRYETYKETTEKVKSIKYWE